MAEVLTRAEMEARYAGEHVLVEDPQTDEHLEVLSGVVLCHSKDRDEMYQEALRLRPKRFAVLYLGERTLPEGTAIVLATSISG